MVAVSPHRALAVHLLAGALSLATAAPAGAAQVSPGPPGYVHEIFGVDDGLPSAGIVEALETADGYLWLATFDGLVRFDGARFEVLDGERVPALGSNRIVDLLEDRDQTLWILSEQGHLARLADGRFTACAGAAEVLRCDLDRAGAPDYYHLHQDRDGVVWVGGRRGVYRIDGDRLQTVAALPPGHPVRALESDGSGRLWAGTRRGLWTIGAGGPEPVDLGRWNGEPVQSLALSADGDLWVSIDGKAIGRLRQGRFTIEIASPGEVARGPEADVWISLPGRLQRYRGGTLETVMAGRPGLHYLYGGRNLLVDHRGSRWQAWANLLFLDGRPVLDFASADFSVSSVSRDRGGSVWATINRSAELHAFHPARLTTLVEGLPSPVVYPLYEDTDGTLWAGGFFLARLRPGAERFEAVDLPGHPQREARALLRHRDGRLWVGTSRGLFDLGGDAPREPEQENADVFALAESADGGLWVGTSDGLARRDRSGRWWSLGPAGTKVRVILEGADGGLWLGTDGYGVLRYRDGVFTSVDRSQGLSSDLVRAMWSAPDGRLWIATENHGLNRLDPATVDAAGEPDIAVVRRAQGLHSSGVHALVDDGLGNLWMSSNQGIFRAALDDLEAVADGAAEHVDVVVYNERDGMLAREANGGGQQSGLRDRDGRIWFPTQAGVVRLDPRKLVRRVPPPPIHLRSLRSGDVDLPLAGGPVEIEPSRRSFTVAYSAPFFRAPERLQFRYRLVPYDDEWVDAGGRREAFYTRVPPGRYRFEAAVGYEGAWSDPAVLPLHVVPRFFETRWFLFVGVVAAVALVAGGLRLRGERQRARSRQLERLVAERTATIAEQADRLRELDRLKSQLFANVSHELRTPLTLILGPLGDALEGRFGAVDDELAAQLGVAERNSRRLLGLVDQLLDVSRVEAGKLEIEPRRGDLRAHLRGRVEAFRPLAERCGVELSLAAPPDSVEVRFDAGQLEKVFDNLLGNALKFTPAGGRLAVALAPAEGGAAEVTVTDDGPGIPPADLERVFDRFYQVEVPGGARRSGVGLGLALARHLVELHGGSIRADNAAGGGARFTVRLPLERDRAPSASFAADTPGGGPEPTAPAVWIGAPEPVPEGDPGPQDDRSTVLVIDDDAEIRTYVRRHLDHGYRVVEAADGAEGLERARRWPPDLVISDLMMPGLDGNAVFRSLREDPELELVPVILLTARADEESRLQGLRDGLDEYMIKPFDPRELAARVENLISLRRRLRDRIGAPRGLEVSAIEATPADRAFLERVQGVVEERLADPELSVEALADALGCDRSHLLRRLRALIDETPSALIRSLRLQRAAQLLSAGAGAVNEIAYAVGFKSVAHFSNAFLERYGERPSAFAARHRQG